MPNPHLPRETLDYIVDFLHDEPETLKACCLASKSWVPRTRKHLFSEIAFGSGAKVERWTKAFPDSTNPPRVSRSGPVCCLLSTRHRGRCQRGQFCSDFFSREAFARARQHCGPRGLSRSALQVFTHSQGTLHVFRHPSTPTDFQSRPLFSPSRGPGPRGSRKFAVP